MSTTNLHDDQKLRDGLIEAIEAGAITQAQAARIMGCSKTTVKRFIDDEINHFREEFKERLANHLAGIGFYEPKEEESDIDMLAVLGIDLIKILTKYPQFKYLLQGLGDEDDPRINRELIDLAIQRGVVKEEDVRSKKSHRVNGSE